MSDLPTRAITEAVSILTVLPSIRLTDMKPTIKGVFGILPSPQARAVFCLLQSIHVLCRCALVPFSIIEDGDDALGSARKLDCSRSARLPQGQVKFTPKCETCPTTLCGHHTVIPPSTTRAFNYSVFVIWAQLPLNNVHRNCAIPCDHLVTVPRPKYNSINQPPMWFIAPDVVMTFVFLLQVGARVRQSRLFVPDEWYANLRLLGNLVSRLVFTHMHVREDDDCRPSKGRSHFELFFLVLSVFTFVYYTSRLICLPNLAYNSTFSCCISSRTVLILSSSSLVSSSFLVVAASSISWACSSGM